MTTFHTANIDGQRIFYREAGQEDAPVLLLLHGFPSSSHMFRDLIPALADTYHVIAPDMPGFGFSDAPGRAEFTYTFENLTEVIDRFTEVLGLDRYIVYVFDYGAPVGLRSSSKVRSLMNCAHKSCALTPVFHFTGISQDSAQRLTPQMESFRR